MVLLSIYNQNSFSVSFFSLLDITILQYLLLSVAVAYQLKIESDEKSYLTKYNQVLQLQFQGFDLI